MSPAASSPLQWVQNQDGSSSSPVPSLWLTLLLLPILLLMASICYFSSSKKKPNNTLPPSPPKLPFIGNLHQLGSLPHRSLATLAQKHGPIMLLQMGQIPTLVITSAELAREVTKTHDLAFANRPSFQNADALVFCSKNISFAPYGEYWRQAKKICAVHLLNPKRVHSFRPRREEQVSIMIERIGRNCKAVFDLSEILYSFANGLVSRVASGGRGNDEASEKFRELLDETVGLMGGFRLEEVFPSLAWVSVVMGVGKKIRRLFGKWDAFLEKIVEEHERNPGEDGDDDFVDVLLSLQRDPGVEFVLPRDNIKAIVMDIIAAGTDTTNVVLEWAMSELIRNPEVMKRAQEEVRRVAGETPQMVSEDDITHMSYLKAVIKEVLRLHPPAPLLIPHESTEDTQLQGYEIPMKTRVIINARAIARDPKSWDEPEEFKPERFLDSSIDFRGHDFQFIPFGAGRRSCPGINFAMAAVDLALANLLFHFNWSLPYGMSGEHLDMSEAPGITISRKLHLQLVATPQYSS